MATPTVTWYRKVACDVTHIYREKSGWPRAIIYSGMVSELKLQGLF